MIKKLPILTSEIEYILGENYITRFCPKVLNVGDITIYQAKLRDLNYLSGSWITSTGLETMIEKAKKINIVLSIDFGDRSIDFHRYYNFEL